MKTIKISFLFLITFFVFSFACVSSAYAETKRNTPNMSIFSQLESNATHVVIYAVWGSTFLSYLNRYNSTFYSLKDTCNMMMVECTKWKQMLRTLVVENKEAMRDFYLGCKLGYHAVTQKDAKEEVPDDILVQCYGDTLIPEGKKLFFPRKFFLQD